MQGETMRSIDIDKAIDLNKELQFLFVPRYLILADIPSANYFQQPIELSMFFVV